MNYPVACAGLQTACPMVAGLLTKEEGTFANWVFMFSRPLRKCEEEVLFLRRQRCAGGPQEVCVSVSDGVRHCGPQAPCSHQSGWSYRWRHRRPVSFLTCPNDMLLHLVAIHEHAQLPMHVARLKADLSVHSSKQCLAAMHGLAHSVQARTFV